jgi:hypothetical protein
MTAREDKLQKEGWMRRSAASEPRLGEIVALYRELGYEVRLEPLDEEEQNGACSVCFGEDPSRFQVVYTRPGSGGHVRDGDGPAA